MMNLLFSNMVPSVSLYNKAPFVHETANKITNKVQSNWNQNIANSQTKQLPQGNGTGKQSYLGVYRLLALSSPCGMNGIPRLVSSGTLRYTILLQKCIACEQTIPSSCVFSDSSCSSLVYLAFRNYEISKCVLLVSVPGSHEPMYYIVTR